jgi:hypothetical protein
MKFWLIGGLLGLIIYGLSLLYPSLYLILSPLSAWGIFISPILFFIVGSLIGKGLKDKKTNKMSMALKVGIVGFIFGFLCYLLYFVVQFSNNPFFLIITFPMGFACMFHGKSCQIIGLGNSLFIFSIIGALIGFIIDKIKK